MTLCIVLGALLGGSGCAAGTISAAAPPPSRFETATIPAVSKPVFVPKPRFTRTTYAATQLAGSDAMLDACEGPIAVNLGAGWPVLIAQHNYCGGSAWMPKLNLGDGVRLKGDGIAAGIYVVTEIRYGLRGKAKVHDMPYADAVLQTCVTKKKLILVGLDWVGDTATA